MFQKRRQHSAYALELRGVSKEQSLALYQALQDFDQGYNDLIVHLKSLGATVTHYKETNGAIKRRMGKPRYKVNIYDREEMVVWSWGYALLKSRLYDLSVQRPGEEAKEAFSEAIYDHRIVLQIEQDLEPGEYPYGRRQ